MVHAWFDVSAGVAGDMLLGSLLDAGADAEGVRRAIDAVAPSAVELTWDVVSRAGQRATKARVGVRVDDPPHRTWRTIRQLLEAADLAETTRSRAAAVFALLAQAEGHVHGIDAEEVHFHEVGALDAIADVVGTCEALRLLGVDSVSASPVALGSGRVRAAHGDIPVPVPAVAGLAVGWRTVSPAAGAAEEDGHGHSHRAPGHCRPDAQHHERPAELLTPGEWGELATPTGLALVRALASTCEPCPPLEVTGVGVGAGGRDTPGRANVVRVVLGAPASAADRPASALLELMANVDDLDPRLWPAALSACLVAGAADAWCVPIHMKKGRPAFTLHALAAPDAREAVVDAMLTHTTTLGVREVAVTRTVLERHWVDVEVAGRAVPVKIGSREGVVVHAAAEFEALASVADAAGLTQPDTAQRAAAAIVAAGLVAGEAVPPGARSTHG